MDYCATAVNTKETIVRNRYRTLLKRHNNQTLTMPNTDYGTLLAANLSTLMKNKEWKVNDLSRKSGVSPRMIRFILDEGRSPSISIVSKLASALRISPAVLISELSDSDIEHLKLLDSLTDDEISQVRRYAELLMRGRD